ncbi:MAG: alginate export family protein [Acidobacteria bacterium]|nr:alginate export family protein [Acidobacteriota bacterium]
MICLPQRTFNILLTLVAIAALNLSLWAQQDLKPAAIPSPAASPKPTPTPTPVAAKAPAAPVPLKIGNVTVSGSLRLRAENWDWFDTNSGDGSYTFGAGTLRVALSQQKEHFEWLVEGEAPFVMGLPTRAIALAPQGQLGLGANYYAANGNQDASVFLKQAFINFKGFGKANNLKIGRFEFNDGLEVVPKDATLAALKRDHISQRLIGSFGWSHVGRSFDGLQYGYNNKGWNFTFFGARPTEGAFQLRGMKELDVDLFYAATTKAFKSGKSENEARAFVIQYHDGRRLLKVDNRSAALRNADLPNKLRITSVGGHYLSAIAAGKGKVDVLLWGVGQFGSWGNQDHRAGALALEAGYQFGGKLGNKIKPWIRAGYNYSTGDNDTTDGTHRTYFQLLPTPRIYARTPFFNAMNTEDTFVQFKIKPHTKLALRTDLHHLRLSSAKDLWYAGGGAFQKQTFGFAGRPSNGQKSLGWFADVSADYTFNPRTSVTFYFGGSVGGKVQSSIYPQGNKMHFAYFELTQKF